MPAVDDADVRGGMSVGVKDVDAVAVAVIDELDAVRPGSGGVGLLNLATVGVIVEAVAARIHHRIFGGRRFDLRNLGAEESVVGLKVIGSRILVERGEAVGAVAHLRAERLAAEVAGLFAVGGTVPDSLRGDRNIVSGVDPAGQQSGFDQVVHPVRRGVAGKGRARNLAVVRVGIGDESRAELFLVIQAFDCARLIPRLVQRGQQHRRQNRNNRYHHEQQKIS